MDWHGEYIAIERRRIGERIAKCWWKPFKKLGKLGPSCPRDP